MRPLETIRPMLAAGAGATVVLAIAVLVNLGIGCEPRSRTVCARHSCSPVPRTGCARMFPMFTVTRARTRRPRDGGAIGNANIPTNFRVER